MQKRLVIPTCLVALLWAAGAAAAPTTTGVTGQFEIPTADVSGHNTLTARLGFGEGHAAGAVNVGIYPGVELGVQAEPDTAHSNLQLGVFGKVALAAERQSSPALALGFDDNAAFAVASKALTRDLRLSVGYGSGWMRGPFAGVSMTLNPVTIERDGGFTVPSTQAMLEYVAGRVDAGVRFTFNPELRVDAALQSPVGGAGGSHIGVMLGASFSTAL